ncbi:STAS domain-containing protein [Actinomadura sp. NEAU-AAG7]|uniref:STAS domain-containing protein n=1 Tax=Actinomadura sp. NEAU-AAG7 TaxID=2839640 RepID=UPI001BE46C69|nr:STAS domain-containing protein [Actinomadura sp. NEAU-AAG7]MBT2212675.1 STAS domain-containing protein [Actinomadura sp. NEAU-AAG7]
MSTHAVSPDAASQVGAALRIDTAPARRTAHPRGAASRGRVAVAGELDIATSGLFRVGLAGLIRSQGPDIVIDASALTFCDARGVAAIVAAGDLAERQGGSVTLTRVRPQVAKVLRITGVHRRFVRPGAAWPRRG